MFFKGDYPCDVAKHLQNNEQRNEYFYDSMSINEISDLGINYLSSSILNTPFQSNMQEWNNNHLLNITEDAWKESFIYRFTEENPFLKRKRINISAAFDWLNFMRFEVNCAEQLMQQYYFKLPSHVKHDRYFGHKTPQYLEKQRLKSESLYCEKVAINIFQKALEESKPYRTVVTCKDIINPKLPFLIGEIDGFICHPLNCDYIEGIVEVKSFLIDKNIPLHAWLNSSKAASKGIVTCDGQNFELVENSKIWTQMQLQMAISGQNHGFLLIYHRNYESDTHIVSRSEFFKYIRVERNDYKCYEMLNDLEYFYKTFIFPKIAIHFQKTGVWECPIE